VATPPRNTAPTSTAAIAATNSSTAWPDSPSQSTLHRRCSPCCRCTPTPSPDGAHGSTHMRHKRHGDVRIQTLRVLARTRCQVRAVHASTGRGKKSEHGHYVGVLWNPSQEPRYAG
jgi:hypothetical protein